MKTADTCVFRTYLSLNNYLLKKMIKKIVVLFGADSDLEWGRSYQMGNAFSQLGHDVLYIDLPKTIMGTITDVFQTKKQRKLNIFRPKFGLPYTRSCLLEICNNRVIGAQVTQAISRAIQDIDLLWVYSPYQPSIAKMLIDKFHPDKIVYDCADDRVAMAEQNSGPRRAKIVTKLESEVTSLSDCMFVVSENLKQVKETLHSDIFVVPNGVDNKHFSSEVNRKEPAEFNLMKGKKILYLGSVECWVDVELVRYCAEQFSEHSFVLIGPVKENIDKLKDYQNIYLLGPRQFKVVPDYINFTDICIIPFKPTDSLKSSNTLKALQYICMDKPVLSTYYSGINDYDGLVDVANNHEEFIQKLYVMIHNPMVTSGFKREKMITNNTWQYRAQQALEIIYEKVF